MKDGNNMYLQVHLMLFYCHYCNWGSDLYLSIYRWWKENILSYTDICSPKQVNALWLILQ